VSAKGTRRWLANNDPTRTTSTTSTRTTLGRLQGATGEAECATTQIVHCDSSRELECWWVAKPYADNSVDSRHNHAIRFMADRMNTYPTRSVHRIYSEMEARCQDCTQPTLRLFRHYLAEKRCGVQAKRCSVQVNADSKRSVELRCPLNRTSAPPGDSASPLN